MASWRKLLLPILEPHEHQRSLQLVLLQAHVAMSGYGLTGSWFLSSEPVVLAAQDRFGADART